MLVDSTFEGTVTTAPPDAVASMSFNAMLVAALGPSPRFFNLSDEDQSLDMSEEDEIEDVPFVEGLVASAINLVQAREGLMKSFTYLELALRSAWNPTPEELAAAIARSPYAGTTDKNEWMEAPVTRTGRVVFLAAEGKRKMHRKRARSIMRNNMGVHTRAEQNRILDRVKIISIRSLYNVLVAKNPDFDGVFSFFEFNRQTGRYRMTEFANTFFATMKEAQNRAEKARETMLAMRDLTAAQIVATNEHCDKERYVMAVIDTFGALWGVSSLDGTGLQSANQRVNAECDVLDIAAVVIAHTVKSEDVDKDDHRASGSGKVEMHSTVENTHYSRPANEAELKVLAAKGECGPADDYVAWRVGKTNLVADMRTRLLKKGLRDFAPVCISRKLSLVDDRVLGARGGFTYEQISSDLLTLFHRLYDRMAKPPYITANLLQSLIEDPSFLDQEELPSLRHIGKNKAIKGKPKDGALPTVASVLTKAEANGVLRSEKHRNGFIYHPAEF